MHETDTADSAVRYPGWNQPKEELPLWDGGAQQGAGISFLECDSEGWKDGKTAASFRFLAMIFSQMSEPVIPMKMLT